MTSNDRVAGLKRYIVSVIAIAIVLGIAGTNVSDTPVRFILLDAVLVFLLGWTSGLFVKPKRRRR